MHYRVFSIFTLIPAVAYAHIEHAGRSFLDGLLHPVTGPDHLLAMLSVGIVSTLIGGRAVFLVPAAFVLFMIIGGYLGVHGIAVPRVEFGIAGSVLVLGGAIAAPYRFPMLVTMCVVGLFGVMHGNAHGVEMPNAAAPVFYTLGFILMTSVIHLAGVGIGYLRALNWNDRAPMRVAGAAIAVIGMLFLAKAF